MDNTLHWVTTLLGEAKQAHTEQVKIVEGYRASYLGYSIPEATDGSSNIKMLDVMRTVEGSLPSLVEPFVGRDICSIESDTPESDQIATLHEDAINKTWNKINNSLDTVEVLARNQMIDGTAWLRTGTDIDGNPTAENVQFESVIPDPTATKLEDMKFCFYRDRVSIADILLNSTWYGEHTLDSLKNLGLETGSSEYEPVENTGQDQSFDPGQRALEEVELFEFYGEYDANGDGTTAPYFIVFNGDMILNMVEAPFPDYTIPFDNTIYVKDPFSIYGKGVSALIDQHQAFRTSITRGIVNNMANSNNGVKFIKKGTLDPINFQRLMNKERVVELNIPQGQTTQNVIYDGSYNPIPSDVYHLMTEIEEDEENLTGITKYATGTDSKSLNQTATGVSIISSMSQKRLVYITQHISGLLTRVFKKWIKINSLLNNIPSDGLYLVVKAGTAGLTQKKVSDIMMMLSVLSPQEAQVRQQLLVDLAEELQLDSAKQILEQPQEPNEDMEIMKQIEVEKAMSEINENNANASKDKATAYETTVDATIKSLGGAA